MIMKLVAVLVVLPTAMCAWGAWVVAWFVATGAIHTSVPSLLAAGIVAVLASLLSALALLVVELARI